MYNSKLYEVDVEHRQEAHALIQDGAMLFRIASLSHWEKEHILSGNGPLCMHSQGRFHDAQRTSYCANNVIICISEMLFHMYRRVLDGIKKEHPIPHITSWFHQKSRLVIFSVEQINELVYVDSIGAKEFDNRILSSTVIFPDDIYEPLRKIAVNLRIEGKSGVVYPSARHSRDLAFAFFNDETDKVKSVFYEAPFIKLQLIVEDQDKKSFPPRKFLPHTDKLHATMGYYEFEDIDYFEKLKAEGLIYPDTIPSSGYVDFVRRNYLKYPVDAVLP